MDCRHIVEIVDRNICNMVDMSQNHTDKELKAIINGCIDTLEKRIPQISDMRETIVEKVYNGRRKLGLIQPLLDDPEIDEIMINGTDCIYIEKQGRLTKYDETFTDKEYLLNVIQIMLSWGDRTVNESNPIADGRLSEGSRINVVLNPIAINGPAVTIRKFAEKPFTMESFVENGTIRKQEADYMLEAVKKRKNIMISGSTSSGKTTFLNVLADHIPEDKRIITIEDSAELRIKQPNVIRLEMRNANTEGRGLIKMRDLIKTALRMRPDCLLVGEVRDESALDMLTALCTGHEGSMSTAHANSAKDLTVRLETMALWEGHVSSEAIRQMIASGIDIIIHLARTEEGRKVKEICEVTGYEKGKIKTEYIYRL